MLIELLKNFNANSANLDELVSLSALARSFEAEYTEFGVEMPEWISNQLKSLRREIKIKNHDRIAARVREVKIKLESMKTPTQKKTDAQSELKRLEKLLQMA